MKGIYLTEEGKKEIEAKIAELEQFSPIDTFEDYTNFGKKQQLKNFGKKQQLKEILSSATILPVDNNYVSSKYPNGVIIQPKQ